MTYTTNPIPNLTTTKAPFPPWPEHHKGTLLHFQHVAETPHHILGMQHHQLPVLNEKGEVMGYSHHHRDKVIKKDGAPDSLWGNGDWEQVLEETVELRGMKYLKVVRVRFRNKVTGEIVSREMETWQHGVFPGGAIIQPHIYYSDGTQALLYLEEWRAESGRVVITFPDGMMDHLPGGRQETPIAAALRELEEEGGIRSSENVTITISDHWQKEEGITGMGQLRHFFRVAVHGLEKGVVPTPKPEADERLVVRLVPIDSNLASHFNRYTEENGYFIRGEFQKEIDRIVQNL